MTRRRILALKFVDVVPEELCPETIYVSTKYATVVHECACGCGHEIVTPLSPKDWKFVFDGETVSLYPSIGNWSLPCRSHYWIKRNTIRWAADWSEVQVEAARRRDRALREEPYGQHEFEGVESSEDGMRGFWWWIRKAVRKLGKK